MTYKGTGRRVNSNWLSLPHPTERGSCQPLIIEFNSSYIICALNEPFTDLSETKNVVDVAIGLAHRVGVFSFFHVSICVTLSPTFWRALLLLLYIPKLLTLRRKVMLLVGSLITLIGHPPFLTRTLIVVSSCFYEISFQKIKKKEKNTYK